MERNEKNNRDDFPLDAEFTKLLPAPQCVTTGQYSQNTDNRYTNDCLVHLLYIWKFSLHYYFLCLLQRPLLCSKALFSLPCFIREGWRSGAGFFCP